MLVCIHYYVSFPFFSVPFLKFHLVDVVFVSVSVSEFQCNGHGLTGFMVHSIPRSTSPVGCG